MTTYFATRDRRQENYLLPAKKHFGLNSETMASSQVVRQNDLKQKHCNWVDVGFLVNFFPKSWNLNFLVIFDEDKLLRRFQSMVDACLQVSSRWPARSDIDHGKVHQSPRCSDNILLLSQQRSRWTQDEIALISSEHKAWKCTETWNKTGQREGKIDLPVSKYATVVLCSGHLVSSLRPRPGSNISTIFPQKTFKPRMASLIHGSDLGRGMIDVYERALMLALIRFSLDFSLFNLTILF